jgi:transcription initiation factor IIE alpha subunit
VKTQNATVKKGLTKPKMSKAGKTFQNGEIDAVSKEIARSTIDNHAFSDYIAKNIGSRANDVLSELCNNSQIDDVLAEKLSLKINETRRILNLLNGYGIVRYEVNKDKKGWLTFRWYIDGSSLTEFSKQVIEKASEHKETLPSDCNDFFMCQECYKKQKIIFPFDVAYETNFKCECGESLKMLTRAEAEAEFIH